MEEPERLGPSDRCVQWLDADGPGKPGKNEHFGEEHATKCYWICAETENYAETCAVATRRTTCAFPFLSLMCFRVCCATARRVRSFHAIEMGKKLRKQSSNGSEKSSRVACEPNKVKQTTEPWMDHQGIIRITWIMLNQFFSRFGRSWGFDNGKLKSYSTIFNLWCKQPAGSHSSPARTSCYIMLLFLPVRDREVCCCETPHTLQETNWPCRQRIPVLARRFIAFQKRI